jgi:hypothetical protein
MAKAKGKRRSAAREMFGHLRSDEEKPTKPTTTHAGDKHPAIPGLVRKRSSAAQEMFGHLRTVMAVLPGGGGMAALLSNAARGSTSPLGGVAKPAPSKGRKR